MATATAEPSSGSADTGSALALALAGVQHAARIPWAPCELVTHCVQCSAPFTFFHRKHHCRRCGQVVCGTCSPHRGPAPGYDSPERMCNLCWDVYQQQLQTSRNNKATVTSADSSTTSSSSPDVPPLDSQRSSSALTSSLSHSHSHSSLSTNDPPSTTAAATATIAAVSASPRSSLNSSKPLSALLACSTPNATDDVDDNVNERSTSRISSSSNTEPIASFDSIASWSASTLFNRLSGFGSLLLLDLRPAAAYQRGHVPRALSLPIMPASASAASTETAALLLLTSADLEKRVATSDQRAYKMRQRAHVIVYTETDGESATSPPPPPSSSSSSPSVDDDVNNNNNNNVDDNNVLAAAERAVLAHVVQLLTREKRVASVAHLRGGYATFASRYPFVTCALSDTERKTQRHAHRAAFPWYASEIVPSFMYLGSHVDASNKDHLQHLRVAHVINVSLEVPNHFPDAFKYTNHQLEDVHTTRLIDVFGDTCAQLAEYEARREPVLVHCHQGVSRSAALVIAYLMKSRSCTLKCAYDYVKQRRKQVYPNVGFWRQLGEWERHCHDNLPAPLVTALASSLDEDGGLPIARSSEASAHAADASAASSSLCPFVSTLADCVDIEALERERVSQGGIVANASAADSDGS